MINEIKVRLRGLRERQRERREDAEVRLGEFKGDNESQVVKDYKRITSDS